MMAVRTQTPAELYVDRRRCRLLSKIILTHPSKTVRRKQSSSLARNCRMIIWGDLQLLFGIRVLLIGLLLHDLHI
jgi:hypothetical protein